MNQIKINEQISYIEATTNPLSSDIGIIKDNGSNWLFDVGNNIDNTFDLVGSFNVVISHFHIDHLGNINNININKIYVSKETYKYLSQEVKAKSEVIIVDKEIKIGNLRIFPIPSSHSKGSLALEVDETYTFLGDATYCKFKNGNLSYNSQLLNDQIGILKKLKSPYFLISHQSGLIRNKENVINELEDIYSKRYKNNPEIIIDKK